MAGTKACEAFASPHEIWMTEIKARQLPNSLLEKVGIFLQRQSDSVADKLGFRQADVDGRPRHPLVQVMLKKWARKDTATVYTLKDLLEELGNPDALAALEEGLQGTSVA